MMDQKAVNYRGFDLKKITWGYRDIFKNTIDDLYQQDLLGAGNEKATETFFSLLNKSNDNTCFDHVLKHFLESLNRENSWIMRIPALFSDWTALGSDFAAHKSYMGLKYFEIWGGQGFGHSPGTVAYVIQKCRFLMGIDVEFAYYFALSYKKLSQYLDHHGIDVFVEYALKLLSRSPENAYSFLQLKTKTSRLYVKSISREVRLVDVKSRLEIYLSSISGTNMSLNDLGSLDSDDLIERGTMLVSLDQWAYFPAKVSAFGSAQKNFDFYMVAATLCATACMMKSFNTIHGRDGIERSLDLFAPLPASLQFPVNNAFICLELFRVLRHAHAFFPGARKRLTTILKAELKHRRYPGNSETFLSLILRHFSRKKPTRFAAFAATIAGKEFTACAGIIEQISQQSDGYADSASALIEKMSDTLFRQQLTTCFSSPIHPLSFYPDAMFPVTINTANEQACAMDLKQQQATRTPDPSTDQDENHLKSKTSADSANSSHNDEQDDKKQESAAVPVGFFYDEWNEHDKDYYENWCCLNEKTRFLHKDATPVNNDLKRYSQFVRRMFEKLKPDEARKEKYLQEGDRINTDLLTEFISQHKARISSKANFYEKPYIKKRDLVVSILLDLSGSTGEEIHHERKIIDLEKDAAFILGEGLSEIGDRFGIFGFTGNGREHSEFYVFKDFEQNWDQKSVQHLFAATPGSSTRMGVAIRHTGYKLSHIQAKQKIIILITDGKPMDSGYDPNSRYAQFDVRKANEENYRMGIDAFCISTDENKIEDLEIMFPFHRYVIIQSMIQLPRTLSQFYLKLTK